MNLISKELFNILEDLDIGKTEEAYLVEDDFGNCAVFTNYDVYAAWCNWSCAKYKPNLKRWHNSYDVGKYTIQDELVRNRFSKYFA